LFTMHGTRKQAEIYVPRPICDCYSYCYR
jgi:hypothetical protein